MRSLLPGVGRTDSAAMNERAARGSFRDPSGFIFIEDGRLYRQVNHDYQQHYELLLSSGTYEHLVQRDMLVPHQEVDVAPRTTDAFKVLQPARIPFISYPYEWSFSQLKAAALLTLSVQQTVMAKGMSLKDASAYNVQFLGSKPVLIDTLSFEPYSEGHPWIAYGQFCRHFLAPLALMARRDIGLSQLLRAHIDGVPLPLAVKLLPWSTHLRPGYLIHLHMHARSQQRYSDRTIDVERGRVSRQALLGIVDNLRGLIEGLEWKPVGTEWAEYYEHVEHYSDEAMRHKSSLVETFLGTVTTGHTVWDFGANRGVFSRLAAGRGAYVVCFDIDPAAVERNYRRSAADGDANLLPLVMDLGNPSPALGWAHEERMALTDRGPADCLMALALIHHLAFGNNLPFDRVAAFFAQCGKRLIIEFVPKSDPQSRILLRHRVDIFHGYTREAFERAFSAYFAIEHAVPIPGTERLLYVMDRLSDMSPVRVTGTAN